MPFDQFFTVAVESLSEAFKRGHDDLGFCDTFRTMLMKSGHSKCKGEFNAKQSFSADVESLSRADWSGQTSTTTGRQLNLDGRQVRTLA